MDDLFVLKWPVPQDTLCVCGHAEAHHANVNSRACWTKEKGAYGLVMCQCSAFTMRLTVRFIDAERM